MAKTAALPKYSKYMQNAKLVLDSIGFGRLQFFEESPEKPFMVSIDTHELTVRQAEGLVKHCMDIAPYNEKILVRVVHGYNRGTKQKDAFGRFRHPFINGVFHCPWNKGTTYFEITNTPS